MVKTKLSLQFGDGISPPGVQEILENRDAIVVKLLLESDNKTEILHEGAFRVRRTLGRTLSLVEANTSDWPERAANGTLPAPPRTLVGDTPSTADPALSTLALRWREFTNLARLAVDLVAMDEVWNIAVVDAPAADILRDGLAGKTIRWAPPPPPGDFYADPFAVPTGDGGLWVAFEAFRRRLNRGEIAQLHVGPDGNYSAVRPLLDPGCHVSFPNLLDVNGETLCVPETLDRGQLLAYPVTSGPDGLKAGAPRVLLDEAVVDPVIFHKDDRWWLLGSDESSLNLYIWYAPSPNGPWQAHRANPVKSDIRSTRPAGPVFSVDGEWFRPAQDCAASYGSAVVINRITRLTPEHYTEETVARFAPDPNGPYPDGLHTFVPVGNRVLIDGKRRFISAAKLPRMMVRWLAKRLPGGEY